jgi:Peptidase inhibitor I78 family
MKHALVALFVVPVFLAGCVETMPMPVEPEDQCGASDLQYLVGQRGRVLDGMRFSQPLRVVQPGMAVTMDFQAERLNIWLDDRDVIERVTCG